MLSSSAMAQLDVYQGRVYDLIKMTRSLIGQTAIAAQPGLAQTRWQLLRLLREYQLFKHNEIFDPLIASDRPELVALAKRLKVSCIKAGEDYRLHTTRWSEQGAAQRWGEYQAAVAEIVMRVDDHLEAERPAVAVLLSNVSRTRKP